MLTTSQQTCKQRVKVRLLDDRFCEIHISPRCCYIVKILKRPGKGGRLARVQAAYFGFDNELSAQAYASSLSAKHRATVRPAKRLTGCAYEVKVASDSMTDEQIFRQSAQLSEYDVTPDLEEQPISADEPVSLILADSDISPNQLSLFDIQRELDFQPDVTEQPELIPDPWLTPMLSADKVITMPHRVPTAFWAVPNQLTTVNS